MANVKALMIHGSLQTLAASTQNLRMEFIEENTMNLHKKSF